MRIILTCHLLEDIVRHAESDGGADPHLRANPEVAANRGGAVPHGLDSKPTLTLGREVEAMAVIAHGNGEPTTAFVHLDLDAGRQRVPGDIREGLLDAGKQHVLLKGAEAHVAGVSSDLEAYALLRKAGLCRGFDGRTDAQVRELAGPEVGGEVIDPVEDGVRDARAVLDDPAGIVVSPSLQGPLGRCKPHLERDEVLARLVVQFEGNAGPFVLDAVKRPLEDTRPRGLAASEEILGTVPQTNELVRMFFDLFARDGMARHDPQEVPLPKEGYYQPAKGSGLVSQGDEDGTACLLHPVKVRKAGEFRQPLQARLGNMLAFATGQDETVGVLDDDMDAGYPKELACRMDELAKRASSQCHLDEGDLPVHDALGVHAYVLSLLEHGKDAPADAGTKRRALVGR